MPAPNSPLNSSFPSGFSRNAAEPKIQLAEVRFSTATFAAAFGAGVAGTGYAMVAARTGWMHCAIGVSFAVKVAAAYAINPSWAVGPGGVLPASTNDQITGGEGGMSGIRMDAIGVGVTRLYTATANVPNNVVDTALSQPLYLIFRSGPGAAWTTGASLNFFNVSLAYYSIRAS